MPEPGQGPKTSHEAVQEYLDYLRERGVDPKQGLWTPVSDEEAKAMIGEAVHTGLRKGSDSPAAWRIWKAVDDAADDSWNEALTFAVDGLRLMGFELCEQRNSP